MKSPEDPPRHLPALQHRPAALLRLAAAGMAAALGFAALSGCAVQSGPIPPEGHAFLTVLVKETGGTGTVPGCEVRLEPLFSTSPNPRAASGTSNAAGTVDFVQPHGNYELFVQCPGLEPPDPTYLQLEGAVEARVEVLSTRH